MNGHPDQWISSLDNLHLGKCPMDPAVFGYIRVSQAEGESGLATQRRILTDHGLREILQPGDVVVVPRIDRLARNLSEGLRTIEELHAQGIDIRSLAEGLDTGDDSSTCCSPWPNGRGRPSGTGSRQASTAPPPKAGPVACPRSGVVSKTGWPGHSATLAM